MKRRTVLKALFATTAATAAAVKFEVQLDAKRRVTLHYDGDQWKPADLSNTMKGMKSLGETFDFLGQQALLTQRHVTAFGRQLEHCFERFAEEDVTVSQSLMLLYPLCYEMDRSQKMYGWRIERWPKTIIDASLAQADGANVNFLYKNFCGGWKVVGP